MLISLIGVKPLVAKENESSVCERRREYATHKHVSEVAELEGQCSGGMVIEMEMDR